jgi:glycosyltransferase involved in cell wall biosynthesis
MQFIVIVPLYNMQQWIVRAIDSIRTQSYPSFRCLIGDDLSTDNSATLVRAAIQDDSRFKLISHTEKKYSLGNIATLIELAQPDDEDVLVLVDGDDYLAHADVLQKLADIYRRQNCWMTYGSYRGSESQQRSSLCHAYNQQTIKTGGFRKVKWRASHLKTFKYKLWKQIPAEDFTVTAEEFSRAQRRALWSGRIRTWLKWRAIKLADLIDGSNRYVRRCSDKAITCPMLEIAGPRIVFVEEVLYIYNSYPKDFLFTAKKSEQRWYTRCIRDILKHKPRRARLAEL